MHDAGGVSLYQTFRYMSQIAQELSQIGLLAMNAFTQRLTIDKLHRDEMHAIVLTDLEDLRDVGMTERGGRFSLTNESIHAISIRSNISRKDLQPDSAIEFRVLGQIHFAHSTCAKLGLDLVAT